MQTQTDTQTPQESLFVSCEWWPSERKILIPTEDITTAEWAELHRYVTKSTRPGQWSNANNPALIGIMNAADRRGAFKKMRTEVVMKGVQTGVTEAAHNLLFKRMDNRSHNALVVMESERKARRIFRQRVHDNIRKSPRLADQISDNPDDMTNYSIIMRTGFCVNIGWAGSQAAVASDPCETVILDEVDKYDAPANIEEAKDRTTTYGETGLVMILSTPGHNGGPVAVEFDNCDAACDYHAECPDCGHVQPMDFTHLWWPDKGEPKKAGEWKLLANRVQREKDARYACNGCGSLWDDDNRDRAVVLGLQHFFYGWKFREDIDYPVSVGFRFPSWLSPFKSLSDIAARYLRAQEPGSGDKLRMWHNNEAAEPYMEVLSERRDDAILALRDDRPRGLVPKDISCLLLLADTQQRGFYYEVRAFGRGPQLESWQVREGFIETFDALKDVAFSSEYKDIDGKNHVIHAAFIDSGGGTGTVPKHSRTAEVYEFCRQNPVVRPLKGRQRMTTTVMSTRIDHFPATKKPIPGGLTLYNINVTHFKDQLASKLSINPTDPGAWHLHSECPEEYAAQMTAEHRDDRGRWVCPKGRANHYWDLGVYALAAAEILQVRFWKKPGEEDTYAKAPLRAANNPDRRW
ncbi:MAG: terminase gpA endonuclease subunit [Deltaproteobacteria bacterium]|mgnify:CR=1 FL=1